MSGLSSRVMTMKFMQKADLADENQQEEEKKLKIKDLSEWVLPNSNQVLKRALQKSNVIQSVGYGSINQLDSVLPIGNGDEVNSDMIPTRAAPVGRRKWGEPVQVTEDDTKGQLSVTENDKLESENSGGSLDSLWKSTRKDKIATKKQKLPAKRPADEASEYTPDIPHRKKRSTGPGA